MQRPCLKQLNEVEETHADTAISILASASFLPAGGDAELFPVTLTHVELMTSSQVTIDVNVGRAVVTDVMLECLIQNTQKTLTLWTFTDFVGSSGTKTLASLERNKHRPLVVRQRLKDSFAENQSAQPETEHLPSSQHSDWS